MVDINKTKDMHQKCSYSIDNPKSDIWGFWIVSPKGHLRTPYMHDKIIIMLVS